MSQKKKDIKAINDAKTNDYGQYTENYIKTGETGKIINGKKEINSVDEVLKEISESKDKALAKKQNEILSNEEIEKVKKSNYNNDGATGADSIALGYGANAKGNQAIAIGQGAIANHNNSVAIGDGSEANSSTAKAYLTNDTNNGGRTFAVGGANVKRRITGVADGSDDSDAVTVAQLKRANKIKIYGDNKAEQTFELVKKIEILGSTDTKGDGSIQTWDGKKPEDDKMITVENVKTYVSKSKDAQKIIIGIKNNPRFGTVKLGPNSEVILGVDRENLKLNNKKITGLANGIENSDAVNMQQLKALENTVTNNTSSIANNKKEIAEKLNKADVDVKGDDKYITVTNIDNVKTKYKVAFNENSLKQLVNTTDITNNTYLKAKLDTKADKNANNLVDTDITSWQAKLGTGKVDTNNTGLVTGGAVKTYVDSKIENNTSAINTKLDKKLNKDDLDVTGDNKYITVTSTNNKYKVAFDDTKLTNTVNNSDFSANKSIQDMLKKKSRFRCN